VGIPVEGFPGSIKAWQDLGVLPGDFVDAGLGLNNKGEVVGPSFAAPGPTSAIPRAFLWANGKMHDLNTLVPPDSPLYLLIAYGINDSGEIAGLGFEKSTSEYHAFLATPCDRTHSDTDWCKNDRDGAAAEADRTIARTDGDPQMVCEPERQAKRDAEEQGSLPALSSYLLGNDEVARGLDRQILDWRSDARRHQINRPPWRRVYFMRVAGNRLTMKSRGVIVPMTGKTSIVEIELVKAD
jgi:probable HAF family extracellular repeat protein